MTQTRHDLIEPSRCPSSLGGDRKVTPNSAMRHRRRGGGPRIFGPSDRAVTLRSQASETRREEPE